MKLSFKLLLLVLVSVSLLTAENITSSEKDIIDNNQKTDQAQNLAEINREIILKDHTRQSNPRISLMKSALIPGWGELSNGSKSGYVFLSLEVAFWFSKYYVNTEKKLSEREAYNYAVQYAHIDPMLEYSEEYYGYLKKYGSSGYEPGGFNAIVVETAMALYPNDIIEQNKYIKDNSISEEKSWNWSSYEDRAYYSGRRTDILDYSDMSKAIGGMILANHLISGINSLLGNVKQNKRLETQVYFDSKLNPALQVSYKF